MSEPTKIEVRGCWSNGHDRCAFYDADWNECRHPDSPADANVGSQYELPEPNCPDWCPLRAAATLVELKVK